WNAWPTLIKNSENNSAAPIESRTEFLFIMHLLLVGRVDPSSGHAAQQSTCQYFFRGSRMFIRLFVRFILVGCRDRGRSECLDNQPRIESNLIMMESIW